MKGVQPEGNEDTSSRHQPCGEEEEVAVDSALLPQHETSPDVGSNKARSTIQHRDNMRYQHTAKKITELRDTDIVFGRGHFCQNRNGNIRMRKIIEKYSIQYQNLRKPEKKELVQIVYREITEDGARFLKRYDDNKWEVVEKSDALKKVSQTLRDNRLDSPSLFLSEPVRRVRSSSSIAVPVAQRPAVESLPRRNLLRTQNPTIPYLGATPLQDVGRANGRGTFICNPTALMPQSYSLSSQINFDLLRQERHRQQLETHRHAMLLQQLMQEPTASVAPDQLANQSTTAQQSSTQSITKSDIEEQRSKDAS